MSSRSGDGPRTDELTAALREAKAAEDGPDAGAVLAAAGALMRRAQSFGVRRAEVDEALRELPRAAAVAWLESASVEPAAAALALAVDESIEAVLATTDEERTARACGALAALAARDRLESSLVGLSRYEALVGGLGSDGGWRRDRLAKQVADLDAGLRGRCRALAAVNPERRRERDLLDEGSRDAAWWYTSRAECDALAGALAGKGRSDPHLDSCPACKSDLAATAGVDAPLGRHLTADDLWNHEMDSLDPDEARRVARHAERCSECAMAMTSMSDAEAAVQESD